VNLTEIYGGKRSKLRTALVLAGGGSKGAVEAGILDVIMKKIIPDVIIGISVGSVNGAAIATGIPTQSIVNSWLKLRKKDIFPFNYKLLYMPHKSRAVHSNRRWKWWLKKWFNELKFEDCKIPLYLNTTRLSDGKAVFFNKGKLVNVIMASTALPPYFRPYELDRVEYVDGGLSDFLGDEELLKLKFQQAIIVTTGYSLRSEHYKNNVFNLSHHAMDLIRYQTIRKEIALCRSERKHGKLIEISPKKTFDYHATDFDHTDELINAGRQEARKALRQIKM
jgi:predicted acylesterase/phospholipase RssA